MRFYSFISRNGRRPFYLLIVRILPLESEFFWIMKNMKLSMLDIQILSAKEIPYIFQNKFEIIFQSQTQNTNGIRKRSEGSSKYDSYTISECIYFVDFSNIICRVSNMLSSITNLRTQVRTFWKSRLDQLLPWIFCYMRSVLNHWLISFLFFFFAALTSMRVVYRKQFLPSLSPSSPANILLNIRL